VEVVSVETKAVLGTGVTLTMSTRIIDVTGYEPVEHSELVPVGSVIIPGRYTKAFPSGNYNVQCALIIGKRKESINKKLRLMML
jgi:2,3,4,5-tetrahydropyridine-2-carboxylate N-succinyltransferase